MPRATPHGHRPAAAGTARSTAALALPPECKLVAVLAFVLVVVATPRRSLAAHGAFAGLLVVAMVAAAVPGRALLRRMRIEAPFVAFAAFLPIVGTGPRVDVLGVSLSQAGLWGAWSIVAKGTLGVAATGLLIATTPVPDLLAGLERLRVPRPFVAITASMVRYGDVLAGELHRMRVARLSRAHDPRWFWQARAVAATAGALFVRAYERGERVHLAMQARGYTGTVPRAVAAGPAAREWAVALALPAAAAAVAVAAVAA